MNKVLLWDLYSIKSSGDRLHGVMLRGRIRKFALENDITCLVENASDEKNVVRFAVIENTDPHEVIDFIKKLLSGAEVSSALMGISNPVLSKIKINDESRYQT